MSNNPDPDGGLIIEVSVPANTAIFYLEAAMKIGLEELQRNGRFMKLVGAYEVITNIDEAEESMKVIIGCITQAKQQVIQLFQSSSAAQSPGDSDDDDDFSSIPHISFAKTDKAGSSSDDDEESPDSGKSPLEK